MTIDAISVEPQFLDHCAPVWRSLPAGLRGRYLVDGRLAGRAAALGLEVELIDVDQVKRDQPMPPKARPGDGPVAFVASIGDIKLARRLGYRQFAFIEHGAGQSYLGDRNALPHPSYAGGIDREDVGLFMTPNESSARLWRKAYPAATVEVVGCPRLDELPAREPGPGRVVAISFHWPGFTAPEADTAVGYYMLHLRSLAERFTVIGHSHPKGDWPARMERIYDRAGIPFVADFDEVCRRADVYACDNSSTIFEFASTGRPVVVLNAPTYRRNVQHGLRFWEAADVGVQVDGPDELAAGIDVALEDAPARVAARNAALELVYAYRTGAAERAAAAIASWIETRQAVAA